MLTDEDWLNRRYYGGDLPAEAERALHQAALCWSDEAAAETQIQLALSQAPGHLAVHLGAYKFYFYRHRLAEALPQAEACLGIAARRLGLPEDWQKIRLDQARFDETEGEPRLYLFALLAVGYLHLRLGDHPLGQAILEKVSQLDPKDRLGAVALLTALRTREEE